jgi:hypothetical protein
MATARNFEIISDRFIEEFIVDSHYEVLHEDSATVIVPTSVGTEASATGN